ncbi:MAG: hypothetical protein HC875_32935 [Anaerolineales bacterium]|nr:hypothetical protein [Anaerolineales bacterium]
MKIYRIHADFIPEKAGFIPVWFNFYADFKRVIDGFVFTDNNIANSYSSYNPNLKTNEISLFSIQIFNLLK